MDRFDLLQFIHKALRHAIVDHRGDVHLFVGIDTAKDAARDAGLRDRGHATPSSSGTKGWHAPPGGRTGQ